MKLPLVPPAYLPGHMRELQRQIELADEQNVKAERDFEVGGGRIILRSPNGSRWVLEVDNAGVVSASAAP